MGLGSLFVGLHEVSVLVGWVSEKNGSVLLISEYCLNLILREFENGCNHQWLNEAREGIFVSSTAISVNFLFEMSEENDLGIS